MGDENAPEEAQQPGHKKRTPGWLRLVQYIKRKAYEKAAEREKESPQDRIARRTLIATWVMAIVTAVTAGVGVLQWEILRGTLDQMREQERAWISVDIRPRSGFVVNKDGAAAIFDVHVTNRGNSPALNIQAHSRLLAVPYTGKGGGIYGPGACQINRANDDRGISVFPTESATLLTEVPRVSRQSITDNTQAGKVVFMVEVCVDYFSAGDARRHRTGNTYLISHHWFPKTDAHGLILPQVSRYDFKSTFDVDVIDFDHLGAAEEAY